MSWPNPNSNYPLVSKLPPAGEELVSVPPAGDKPVLLGTSASSSTLEAIPGYDQLAHAQIETCQWGRMLLQMLLPHNFTLPETQIDRAGGNLPIRGVTEEQIQSRIADGKAQHHCAECNKGYKRAQELKRHVTDKHMPPRRCPFCGFSWTRPDRMKSHLLTNHAERFSAEQLAGVKTFWGQDFVEFINGYDLGLEVDTTF